MKGELYVHNVRADRVLLKYTLYKLFVFNRMNKTNATTEIYLSIKARNPIAY